jgi:hypothetical protein
MSATLEWRHLRPSDMARLDALPAFDSAAVAAILFEADAASTHPLFVAPLVRTQSQRHIVADLAYHLLRYLRSLRWAHQQQSTAVSLVFELHRESMEQHLAATAAYARLEELLLVHSVQRPPHAVAVFRLDEARALADYVAATYLRYYTLYLHAFTHRRELTLTTQLCGDGAVETLPSQLPPLSGATPLAVFQANAAERRRIIDEAAARQREADEERELLAAEERRRVAEAEDAARREVPTGLRAQLLAVKHQVGRASLEHLSALEAKVAAIEARVAAETLVMPGAGGSVRTGGGARGGDSGGGKRPVKGGGR